MQLVKKKAEYAEDTQRVKAKDMKAPPHHMGLISDSIQLFCPQLLTNDEDSKEFFKEMHGALPFPGNKILMMDKEKDTKWVNAFLDFCKTHYTFVE